MKKNIISRFIATALVFSTLVIGNTTAAQAKTLNPNTGKSNTTVSNLSGNNGQALNTSWGLGLKQTEYVSNNKSYDWYIDQGHTGQDSNNNCGPTSTVMALKWLNPNFIGTVEAARNTYPENDGWWYTNDVTNFLDLNNVKTYTVKQNVTENLLKSDLKKGNIAILCVKMSYIPYNKNSEQRVGRFYSYDGGHFIVVKGYRVVDGKTYFEVYDPNNWDEQYNDGQEKGKDRYYLSANLVKAASVWWNYSIVIQPSSNY